MRKHIQILSPIFRGGIGIFTIEQQYISHIASGLHHLATACEIICPNLCIRCPGLISVEPLAISEEAQARQVIIRRLRCGIVDDKTVQAAGHGSICNHFYIAGIVRVGALPVAIHGERFGCADILSINVGDRSALPYIRNSGCQHGTRETVCHPDCRHRHAGILLRIHTVPLKSTSCFVRLDICSLHPVLGDYLVETVVILCEQFPYGLSPVA